MKSYILDELNAEQAIRAALGNLLPGQTDPWIIWSRARDPIAYLWIHKEEWDILGPFAVVADISGRHYFEDDVVTAVLRALQTEIGGVIRDDEDSEIQPSKSL